MELVANAIDSIHEARTFGRTTTHISRSLHTYNLVIHWSVCFTLAFREGVNQDVSKRESQSE